ncbi:MAG: helix-turn-helix domain-containing protein [Acidobacteria bacterium]|nr:helix-turn-helix domain-containing protein [Acidobacteriota bacterium]
MQGNYPFPYKAKLLVTDNIDLLERIAARVLALRKRQKLSQRALAAKSGVHVNTVARIESGEHDSGVALLSRVVVDGLGSTLPRFFASTVRIAREAHPEENPTKEFEAAVARRVDELDDIVQLLLHRYVHRAGLAHRLVSTEEWVAVIDEIRNSSQYRILAGVAGAELPATEFEYAEKAAMLALDYAAANQRETAE